MTQHHKIAMLTAGGLAPCLSSAVGGLIERYSETGPEAPMIGYLSGYKGLLAGQVDSGHAGGAPPRPCAARAWRHALGNSRVKLTNVADCVKRGLVKEGEDPLKVAAEPAGQGRRHHPPHHRRRRHQHHRGRPRRLSRTPTATSSPSSACPRPSTMTSSRSARRSAPGRPPSRAPCFFENVVNEQSHLLAHAHHPRGHGPQLRLAHRRHGAGLARAPGRAWSSCPSST